MDNTSAEEDLISGSPSEEPQEEVNPELDVLCDRIQEVMHLDESKITITEVMGQNKVESRIQTHNITELNSLLCAASYVTTDRMGMLKERRRKRTEEQFWKRRIKRNIEMWRKDLSRIEEVRKGNMTLKKRERERLSRIYRLEETGTMYVAAVQLKLKNTMRDANSSNRTNCFELTRNSFMNTR